MFAPRLAVLAEEKPVDQKDADDWIKYAKLMRAWPIMRPSIWLLSLGEEPFCMSRCADYLMDLARDRHPKSPPLPIDRPAIVLFPRLFASSSDSMSGFAFTSRRMALGPGPAVGPGVSSARPPADLEPATRFSRGGYKRLSARNDAVKTGMFSVGGIAV